MTDPEPARRLEKETDMTLRSTLLLALLATPAALLAQAPTGAATTQGKTATGFQEKFRARMMTADANRDGKLSQEEFVAARAGKKSGKHDPAKAFARRDADKDGYLSTAEVDRLLARRLARFDGDHDGVVTRAERQAARTGMARAE